MSQNVGCPVAFSLQFMNLTLIMCQHWELTQRLMGQYWEKLIITNRGWEFNHLNTSDSRIRQQREDFWHSGRHGDEHFISLHFITWFKSTQLGNQQRCKSSYPSITIMKSTHIRQFITLTLNTLPGNFLSGSHASTTWTFPDHTADQNCP